MDIYCPYSTNFCSHSKIFIKSEMQNISKNPKKSKISSGYGNFLPAFVSVFTMFLLFGSAISGLYLNTKILVFAVLLTAYLIINIVLYMTQNSNISELPETPKKVTSTSIFDAGIDEKLLVLEEAGKFFGASLKTSDMFNLISSRIADIISYTTFAAFLIDEDNNFSVNFVTGKNSRLLESIRIGCGQGIAGKAFLSRAVELSKNLAIDKSVIEDKFLDGLRSAVAIPLFRGEYVFCVLVLYSEFENNFGEREKVLAEAVANRITPLINSSFSYEKSLSNALTDSLTSLPNERAFYLILENQVAEAQRFPDRRSLTVLAVDIKDFAEINEKYGHSTGDRILAFTAETIKQQLRKMDFIARTVRDEFMISLPTVTDEIKEQIIERIEKIFKVKPFEIAETEKCFIELSFGSATFQGDGETAEQLLKIAKLRKMQSKGNGNNSVIFFPKQYVN